MNWHASFSQVGCYIALILTVSKFTCLRCNMRLFADSHRIGCDSETRNMSVIRNYLSYYKDVKDIYIIIFQL
jgi:hypothetical protein